MIALSPIRFITSSRRARNSARRSSSEIFGGGGAMRQISGGRTAAATGRAPRAVARVFQVDPLATACSTLPTGNIRATASAADTALKRMRRRFVFIYSIHLYVIRFVSGDLDQQPQQ